MKFSDKIIELQSSPKFLASPEEGSLNYTLQTKINSLGIDINIYFDTIKEKELIVSLAKYSTSYNGEYLGVIDGFFALIQNKPIEAIDRFPIKELDYFLRDNNTQSAFSGYSQEIYEILSLGEKLKEVVFGKKDGSFYYDLQNRGAFTELSASEQFEIIEEFLSFYFYKEGVSLEAIECIDIDDEIISFKTEDTYLQKIQRLLNQSISYDLKAKKAL